MSEAIPVGWQRRSLSSLGEYENGFAFNELHWSEHGLPIVRIAQITGTQGIVDRYPGRLTETFRIDSGDLIFSWSGTLAVVRWAGGPAWLNQHLFKVVPAPGIDRSLLFHVLQASVAEMNKRTHGSTMKHIKRGELREFFVSIPVAVDEQRKLALVLDTLDAAIDETEAIIAKLKAVKQGLLHDLLTRGIDANGELRPPQTEAPHLYKQSPLGWIPKEWQVGNVATMTDILDSLRVPVNEAERSKRPGDVPYYGANGQQGWIDRPLFNESLILLAEDGGNFDDFAFRPIAYRIDGPSWVNNHAHILKAKTHCSQAFVFFSLVHRDIRRYISGGTRTKLTAKELKSIELPCPPQSEQASIAQRLESVETRLRDELQFREKLTREKAGLTDDLLTGRVRVTPLLADAERAKEFV